MATTKAKPAAKATGKKAEAPVAKKAPAFAREMDMKFGISDLASALDLDETYTRAKLRQNGVEKKAKGGTAYGWNSKEDLDKVVKLLSKKVEKAAPANKNDKAAPAKKAASAQKTPVGMPAGKDKNKATTPITKSSAKAPNDKAIDKSAAQAKTNKAKLGGKK